ncbi:probable LRR receptor-like serine/threonine-protein kinase At1g14390 isoform X2 [Hibiscus syriacus]|uniref:probable LRR receptor-like serine/threonine-protein kinase At1g14390 isoform X2 n=1 Tax=Hibiscus syriacus TaxID=106335 RepID=UPI0019219DD5|nr:probable LRR receptor-like serine/threonine-protein kinase At1g14390 isoform X2 [Hibiscus syriacus]
MSRMETSRVGFCLLLSAIFMVVPVSIAHLTPSETRLLFQVKRLLQYPEVLQGWTRWTNLCYLPPSPSLSVVCLNSRVTELTIVGNKSSSAGPALLDKFSIDALFTVLTRLSDLKALSLVSLGLWGPLPLKIDRFRSLQSLNMTLNFVSGEIPKQIAWLRNLTSLVLADNLFNGSVPDLTSLTFLQELSLEGNRLGPQLPSLSQSLVSITLSNNSFRSEIPSGLKRFNRLQKLDIYSNRFVGPIPSFLFSMASIQYLNLAQNQLSGALPSTTSCSKSLTFVDISDNHLIGKLPSCIGSNSKNRTVFSSWNCLSAEKLNRQHPYSVCNKQAFAVKPVERKKQEPGINFGLILGIIGGVVMAGAIVLLILVIVRRSRRCEDANDDRSIADKMSVRSSPKPAIDSRRVPQTMRSAAIGLPRYRVFSLEEIEDATYNFDPSNFMGEGSQGQLYKGWLVDGSVVVVKCLKLKQKHAPQNLMQHMEVLSKLRHRHLVSVLGHCIVTYQDHPNIASTVFIVFEHISNRSLKDYLTDWRKKEILKWPQRMAITIGAARGVEFLHTGISPGIYGNDLKIDNIMLDETLTAKISDYNIPLPLKTGSENPSCSDENGEKEDIYQLGILLLQVITGKLATFTSELDELKHQLEKSLAEGPAKLRGVIDPLIRGTFAYGSMKTTVQFTINCLSKDSTKRPSIEDVLWNLQYSIQVQEGWSSSGNLATYL